MWLAILRAPRSSSFLQPGRHFFQSYFWPSFQAQLRKHFLWNPSLNPRIKLNFSFFYMLFHSALYVQASHTPLFISSSKKYKGSNTSSLEIIQTLYKVYKLKSKSSHLAFPFIATHLSSDNHYKWFVFILPNFFMGYFNLQGEVVCFVIVTFIEKASSAAHVSFCDSILSLIRIVRTAFHFRRTRWRYYCFCGLSVIPVWGLTILL